MSTVGYGDVTALSIGGRIVSTIAMLSGVMVLAMPVSVISAQFQSTYEAIKSHDMEGDDADAEAEAEKELGLVHNCESELASCAKQFAYEHECITDVMQQLRQAVHAEMLRRSERHHRMSTLDGSEHEHSERHTTQSSRLDLKCEMIEVLHRSLETSAVELLTQYANFISQINISSNRRGDPSL
eukprot:NODE_9020_length_1452_cov_6.267925.p2 GENE.NODE_9020_length_1452_cov_6.267925~~NODE_9020_length_1452_cov_6.267925.p2  ORF type:complete len:184 (+),score=46.69 NODE_9020_length_1452_cov_6.267925:673-1224(+)